MNAEMELFRQWRMWEDQEKLAETLPGIQRESISRVAIEAGIFINDSSKENYTRLLDAVLGARANGVKI